MSLLTCSLLGHPRSSWEGQDLYVKAQKTRALFFYLVAKGRPVRREHLAELLWGRGRTHNVRQALSELRQLAGAEVWLEDQNSIRVHARTDLEQFEKALHEQRYKQALDLWRGPFLEGIWLKDAPAFNDWLQIERGRLNLSYRHALKAYAALLEQGQQASLAIDHLKQCLALDPLDESAHRSIMRLEYQRGHMQAALAQFEACRQILFDEMGLQPLSETQALAELIQQSKLPINKAAAFKRMPPQLLRPPILLAREAIWQQMERAWQSGQAIFLTGPAGIGKTRLMLDFARSKGRYLLNEGRPGDRDIPFSSMARGLKRIRENFPDIICEPWAASALANILPGAFPDTKARPVPKDVETAQLSEAFVWMLEQLAQRVATLPGDDAHYFDRLSAQIGEAFSARWISSSREHRLITAFRASDMPGTTLDLIQAGVREGQSVYLELEPLDLGAVSELLDSLEMPKRSSFVRQLYSYTGGNPSFIIETLKDLYRRDALEPDSQTFELPERLSLLIKHRLESLDEQALRLLRAVAVTHPYSSIDLLAQVLERDLFEIAETLGDLEAQQMLQGLDFVHDLLLEAVLTHMPSAVKLLLHSKTAEALASRRAKSLLIAQHWQQAGETQKALAYWLEAAKHHEAAGLREEAADLLGKVIKQVAEDKAVLPQTLQEALERLKSRLI